MKKLINITFCFLLIIITSCGFKIVNLDRNFEILEINTSGERKINYVIKNKLLLSSKKGNENVIKINILTDKIKSVKEKNINNQITKYEIKITSQVEYSNLSGNLAKITITKTGSYGVASKYSDTLNNEKNLVNLLTEKIIEEILNNISSSLNES